MVNVHMVETATDLSPLSPTRMQAPGGTECYLFSLQWYHLEYTTGTQ
jgi:hypothetical protein